MEEQKNEVVVEHRVVMVVVVCVVCVRCVMCGVFHALCMFGGECVVMP